MGRIRVALACLVAPAVLVSNGASQESGKPPVFSSELEVVNVTVSVRDGDGRLVSDLTRDDFVILENGRPQTLALFGRAAGEDQGEEGEKNLALDLGLLLDTSTSMLQELKLSQEAAVRFLEAIPRARELFTIFFDSDIRISRYDSENQQGLFERIHEMKGGGDTALYDSIAVYLSRVHDGRGRKVLVLFTDGEDSTSAISLPELIKLVRGSSVTIYAIAFMGGFPTGSPRALKSKSFLMQVSEMTGGQVFAPTASRDLPGIYRKILDELSAQYVLGYVSDDPRKDGKFRKLKVQVKRDGLRVKHRLGYFAPGGDES
jgi:Ca-activated chloride channel homolog